MHTPKINLGKIPSEIGLVRGGNKSHGSPAPVETFPNFIWMDALKSRAYGNLALSQEVTFCLGETEVQYKINHLAPGGYDATSITYLLRRADFTEIFNKTN